MTSSKTRRGILCLLVSLTLVFSAFSVPGVKPVLPDFSGEYVYYRDKSFKTQSYVGFLYYDDSTYAARYYSAADSTVQSPERDITIYITVNPSSSYLDMTGEKVIGSSDSTEDTEVINYLHDLLYEFTARRQKQNLDISESVKVPQTFDQFGGYVTVTYNAFVPIFNIQGITSADGTGIFEAVTTGLLTSSSDASFTAFKGLDEDVKDRKRTFSKKGAKASVIEFEGQKLKVDSLWTKSMDNLWLLGDSALLTLNTIAVPDYYKDAPEEFRSILLKKLSQSTEGSYSIWKKRTVKSEKGKDSIVNIFWQPDTGDVTRDFKILKDMGNGTYAYLTMTVFESIYQKNSSYFTKILKSHSVN